MLGILWKIHLPDFQLHFWFLMYNFIQSYGTITKNVAYYNELWVDMIMNEIAYKGLMICYTNIQLQMSL